MFYTELSASNYLFFGEAQFVAGLTSIDDNPVYNNASYDEAMKKPGIGFDFIKKFSNDSGDWGTLAIQPRLAWNEMGKTKFEPQLYNAYFKYKAGFADLWAGHNKPAIGINSYLDNHALMLHNLTMHGLGYDRDWGLGAYKDTDWGNANITLTTGSGMPLVVKGNYLAAGRISKGTLNQDNFNLGISLATGEVLGTKGVHYLNHETFGLNLAGIDGTYLYENYEARMDILTGKKGDAKLIAAMFRFGINLLEENRLKLEVQPVLTSISSNENMKLGIGATYLLTSDLTLRSLFEYDYDSSFKGYYLQAYYYTKLF